MCSPLRSGIAALLLLLTWHGPVSAAVFAQADGAPIVEYGLALVATALVLLVVCWPAKRQ
jgi:hypothetical protein